MSSVLAESTVGTASQLFLPFADEIQTPEYECESGVFDDLVPPCEETPAFETSSFTSNVPSRTASNSSCKSQFAGEEANVPPSVEAICSKSDERMHRPVKMGAVMIELLKKYGITDEEIAEGMANYARKHQTALAS